MNNKIFENLRMSAAYAVITIFVLLCVRAIFTGDYVGALVYDSIMFDYYWGIVGFFVVLLFYYLSVNDELGRFFHHYVLMDRSLVLISLAVVLMFALDFEPVMESNKIGIKEKIQFFFASNHIIVLISCMLVRFVGIYVFGSILALSHKVDELEISLIEKIDALAKYDEEQNHCSIAWIYDEDSRVSSEWMTKISEGHWVTSHYDFRDKKFKVKHKRSNSNHMNKTYEQIIQEDLEYNEKFIWGSHKAELVDEGKEKYIKDGMLYVPARNK